MQAFTNKPEMNWFCDEQGRDPAINMAASRFFSKPNKNIVPLLTIRELLYLNKGSRSICLLAIFRLERKYCFCFLVWFLLNNVRKKNI